MNTKFSYLYQDGPGHRYFADRIFAGPPDPELVDRLRRALEPTDVPGTYCFVAEQVGLPSVFPWVDESPGTEPVRFRPSEDSLWHHVNLGEGAGAKAGLLVTDEPPTDGRSLAQLVEAVERAKEEGWQPDESRGASAAGSSGGMGSVDEVRDPDASA